MNKTYDAIIAISSDGEGFLMQWSPTVCDWKKEDHIENKLIGVLEFSVPMGIYTANMLGAYCGGDNV